MLQLVQRSRREYLTLAFGLKNYINEHLPVVLIFNRKMYDRKTGENFIYELLRNSARIIRIIWWKVFCNSEADI